MADSAPTPVVQKAKKAAKPKKPATHPKFSEMVVEAIKSLKERGGSSRVKILKYILVNHKVDENSANTYVKMALKKGVAAGLLKQNKGTGASGSFSLDEAAKKAPAKPKVKKPATKKPVAKKTTAKKTPKKTTAKKPATKKTKSPAKKTTTKTKSPKKPTKKPAAKKTSKSPKKTAKKPAKKAAPKKTKA